VAATLGVAQLAREHGERARAAAGKAFWIAGVLGVYGLCLGILELAERVAPGNDVHTNFQRGHTTVSGFLGLLGLGLLYAGLKRSSRGLRIGGLALLGVILAKIAEQVSARRAEQGLSQRELAELVGTTQSAIARLERGGRPPRIDTLLNIADALDCDLVVDLVPKNAKR